jgi:hypothetical protein
MAHDQNLCNHCILLLVIYADNVVFILYYFILFIIAGVQKFSIDGSCQKKKEKSNPSQSLVFYFAHST